MRKSARYGTQEYWKTAHSYEFDLEDGGRLHNFAHSEHAAKIKAGNWEKWLVKTGRGKDKVLKNTIRRIF